MALIRHKREDNKISYAEFAIFKISTGATTINHECFIYFLDVLLKELNLDSN